MLTSFNYLWNVIIIRQRGTNVRLFVILNISYKLKSESHYTFVFQFEHYSIYLFEAFMPYTGILVVTSTIPECLSYSHMMWSLCIYRLKSYWLILLSYCIIRSYIICYPLSSESLLVLLLSKYCISCQLNGCVSDYFLPDVLATFFQVESHFISCPYF